MLKTLVTAGILGTAFVLPAQAEKVSLSRAMAASSLHEGPLDMVAYWVDGPEGSLELTATFRDRETDDEPMRVVMPLQEGDALSFGTPGYRGTLYGVARTGREISTSVKTVPALIAAR